MNVGVRAYLKYNTFILLLLVISVNCQTTVTSKCTDLVVQRLCWDQDVCDQCLQAHPCCNWNYDKSYDGRRCNIQENFASYPQEKIEFNLDPKVEIPKDGNKKFTDANSEEIIQVRPQFVNINLAKDIPQNFTFTYKPAKNYPLDLYYLGDMSATMMAHLKVFKTIGSDLPANLTRLTENYRLAFGSFLDKIAMPFYLMAPDNFNNPCHPFAQTCDEGYLFKHRLSFTKDTKQFIEKVSNSKTSANLDDLDGALDALLQVLVCGKKIGWSENSRKIILLPTDSLLHSAGDGLLAGAVLIPDNTCLLGDDGNHISPTKYDFPSIEQIHSLLKEKKVNIIFAVKDKRKIEYYRSLKSDLLQDSSFVGRLEEDATNIIQLVTEGYYNFARQVAFSINTTLHENLDVKFFADCDRLGILKETSACYNVEENPVEFTVQLTLKGSPTRKNDVVYVEEKNIIERITLNITYPGFCSCQNDDTSEKLACLNGEFRCGSCICQEDWTGKLCDEACDSKDFSSCKAEKYGYICSRNGDCACGKCVCNHPFVGEYCQYPCPTSSDGQICSGPTNGKCIEGKCECNPGFKNNVCSCSTSQDKCRLFDKMDLCSGNGECVCNQCECNLGYSGQYCELNKENNTLCDEYIDVIGEAVMNGTDKVVKGAVVIDIRSVDEKTRKEYCNETFCSTVVYDGNRRCNLDCCYFKDDSSDSIQWLVSKSCVMTAGFAAKTIGIAALAAILLAGLLGIAIAKYRIYRIEQEEYKRFKNESKMFNEMNPIYKDPVTVYNNPMRSKTD